MLNIRCNVTLYTFYFLHSECIGQLTANWWTNQTPNSQNSSYRINYLNSPKTPNNEHFKFSNRRKVPTIIWWILATLRNHIDSTNRWYSKLKYSLLPGSGLFHVGQDIKSFDQALFEKVFFCRQMSTRKIINFLIIFTVDLK